jgi:hypothetical protein
MIGLMTLLEREREREIEREREREKERMNYFLPMKTQQENSHQQVRRGTFTWIQVIRDGRNKHLLFKSQFMAFCCLS